MRALRTSEDGKNVVGGDRAPQRRGSAALVVIVYIVAIAALGAAIYERFFMA